MSYEKNDTILNNRTNHWTYWYLLGRYYTRGVGVWFSVGATRSFMYPIRSPT